MSHASGTVITCHANADWDALASIIGASLLYPGSTLVFPGSMEKSLTAYFNTQLATTWNFRSAKDIDPEDVSRLVVVDTANPGRLTHVAPLLARPDIAVHVWDHHPLQGGEAQVQAAEYHVFSYGSTCSIIVSELEKRGASLTPEQATLLGLGIYGDTGSFAYTSTVREDFLAAAWLAGQGMRTGEINRILQAQSDFTGTHVRLLNDLLESANSHEIGGSIVTIAEVRMDEFINDFAQVAQRYMDVEPSCAALFALGIMDDRTQVVARSRIDSLDVGAICKALGGGGHRYAASASVRDMPPPELRDAIFQKIFGQLNPQHVAKELMSAPAVGIDNTSTLEEADTLMRRYGLKAAPVLRAGTRRCVGFLEAQTAALAVSHGLGHLVVDTYMQRDPQVATPESSLQSLMDIIVGNRQRLVPVVQGDDVIGVVTRTDLINMFVADDGRLPMPSDTAAKEKNLSRMLSSRLAFSICQLLQTAGELGDRMGLNVYAVGGFVRDLLLARPNADLDDIDLVVEGNGIAFARALAQELGGRVREHQAFLTAVVLYNDKDGVEQRVDVATARLEYYMYPAALPTVELSSIKMDLFRRDFTINAMALRVNTATFGYLVDFFGGQNDIQSKTVRVLHALSFIEDPTRMLRAVRFAERYGFKLAGQTVRLIKNAVELKLVDKLSGARITHELDVIVRERSPLRCFEQLQRLGILAAIHPALELTPSRASILQKMETVLEWYRLLYLQDEVDLSTLYLITYTSSIGDRDTSSILDRLAVTANARADFLRLRGALRALSAKLNKWYRDQGPTSALVNLLTPLPIEGALYLMARAPSEAASKNISLYINRWRLVRADVDGKDLKAMGLEPGPLYGDILLNVRNAKLDGAVSTREEQLALARALATERQNAASQPGAH